MKLLSFSARKQNKTNLLQWTTANETTADHFDIERSSNGSPDSYRKFRRIGKVRAGLSNYGFTDNLPLNSVNYYRLKMTDRDGKFTYSPVRAVNNSGSFTVSIYPNPAKDNLQVQIDGLTPTSQPIGTSSLQRREAIQLQIISQDGKMLLSHTTTAATSSILRSINISALPQGNYFLKVTSTENEESVVKFAKQ